MTRTTLLEGLRYYQSAHIPYDVARETVKFFDAVMLFHNERLTLLDIVQSRHPAGEFAFLPGSYTVEAANGCIPNVVLHFSAGVQFSEFRPSRVIGTMWEMGDEDGRSLSKKSTDQCFRRKRERSLTTRGRLGSATCGAGDEA